MAHQVQTLLQTQRPRPHLRIEGVGKEAFDGMRWFFSLAAGYAWPGTLWISEKRVYKRSKWAAIYNGRYSRDYFDLLSNGTNEWKVSLVSLPAPQEDGAT